MMKHKRELRRLCEREGLHVGAIAQRGGHLALHTDKGTLFAPSTPSDRRWHRNMRAEARRLAKG